MNRIVLPLFAAILTITPVRAEDEKPALKSNDESIIVPFKLLKTGHFIVETTLNGKGPYLLIFDTGAPTMLINNRIAKDASVITKKTPKPFFAPFGSMGEFKIKKLKVGEVEATDIQAMVMDHPTVELFSSAFKRELGKPVDGIIGFPFFARYRMTVDYQAKQMSFTPSGYEPGNLMETMTKAMTSGSQTINQPKIVGPQGLWGFVAEKDADDTNAGVVVSEVTPKTAAAKAGLKVGDRVLTVNGRWTDTLPDLHAATGFVAPGKVGVMKIQRGKDELKLSVTPAKGL